MCRTRGIIATMHARKIQAAADPVQVLQRRRVALRVWRAPLVACGRRVLACFDPSVPRVELFGVAPEGNSEALVFTFAHELGHVVAWRRGRAGDEEFANRFAARWMRRRGSADVERCAAALRAHAVAAIERRPSTVRKRG